MYLSKVAKVFVQIANYICLQCKVFYITKWLPVNLSNHQVSDNEMLFLPRNTHLINLGTEAEEGDANTSTLI